MTSENLLFTWLPLHIEMEKGSIGWFLVRKGQEHVGSFLKLLFFLAACLKRIQQIPPAKTSDSFRFAGELIEEQSMQTQTDAWARVVWVFGWV